MAFAALEAFPVAFGDQRLLTDRTNQDVEKILGNHGLVFYAGGAQWKITVPWCHCTLGT